MQLAPVFFMDPVTSRLYDEDGLIAEGSQLVVWSRTSSIVCEALARPRSGRMNAWVDIIFSDCCGGWFHVR